MKSTTFIVAICSTLLAYNVHAWRVVGTSGGFDAGYALTEKSTAPIRTWLRAERPVLTFQCDKNGTTLWLEVGTSLAYRGTYRKGQVRYRYDGGKVLSESWTEATNHGTYGAPGAARMMTAMTKAKTIEFEVTPHNSGPVSFAFDLSDFASALDEFKKSCKR